MAWSLVGFGGYVYQSPEVIRLRGSGATYAQPSPSPTSPLDDFTSPNTRDFDGSSLGFQPPS